MSPTRLRQHEKQTEFTDEMLLLFARGCKLAAEMSEDECFLSTPRYYEYLGIAKRLNIELLGLGCWCNIDGVLDPLLDTKPASYWEGWSVLQEVWPILQRKRKELQAALKARKRKLS